MKPEHAATMSKQVAFTSPSLVCTRQEEAGRGVSGVMVARTSRSISSGFAPAFSIAWRPAAAAMSETFSPSAAMRRERMPVRG